MEMFLEVSFNVIGLPDEAMLTNLSEQCGLAPDRLSAWFVKRAERSIRESRAHNGMKMEAFTSVEPPFAGAPAPLQAIVAGTIPLVRLASLTPLI